MLAKAQAAQSSRLRKGSRLCNAHCMSEQPATQGLPTWDLADKLCKSLRVADISVAEMADHLDVSPRTISNWLAGRIEPSAKTVMVWALRTGIPYTWYCHGDLRPCDYAPAEASSGRRATKMHKLPTRVVA